MLAVLSAFEAASNDKVLANSRLRRTPVHQEISSTPKPGRAKKIRKPMNADGVMDNIRNAFGRSGVTLNELGDARFLTAQPQSSGRGSCCITRQTRAFRQCQLSPKRWVSR